ncbi:phage tail protein [Geotalea uraniireducens]|uniref:Phage Tail Collar domain protein n=1 Tax=Geotalea uraniireducens (strain Rf4) TaxID=351605 RepID=A5GA42_GEOUR|nr:tail fiber protein [Geotalea uraniireducens]ABQ25550.1 phage Tail Collar domain protein [Geotalea uraniireducens Rf4]
MAEPFLGEIRIFPFDFAPRGWALCNGALLPIVQNQALYSLLNTTFGGDGKTNFGLPDLQGRVPMPPGTNPVCGNIVAAGKKDGSETVTLTTSQIPPHTHSALANSINADFASPVTLAAGNIWAKADDPSSNPVNAYESGANAVMDQSALSTAGGGGAHNNMQPYQVVNYCIALMGLYPTRP